LIEQRRQKKRQTARGDMPEGFRDIKKAKERMKHSR